MSSATRPPDFLIVGAARAATSALAVFLTEHPEIHFSRPKEPHFLAHADVPPAYRGIADEENMNSRVVYRPEDWFALFVAAPQLALCGEGSVSTSAWPERAIPAIKRWCPEVKLIACIREPRARLHSAWQYMRSRGHEPIDDLELALRAEAGRIADDWHHMWHYRRLSHYELLLEPFYDAFGEDRIHLVVTEELQSRANEVLDDAFAFLGLEPHAVEATDRPVNTGGELNSGPLGRAARIVASNQRLKQLIRTTLPEGLRHRLQSQVLTTTDIPELDGLREDFAPTYAWVENRLGRVPSMWTQD